MLLAGDDGLGYIASCTKELKLMNSPLFIFLASLLGTLRRGGILLGWGVTGSFGGAWLPAGALSRPLAEVPRCSVVDLPVGLRVGSSDSTHRLPGGGSGG